MNSYKQKFGKRLQELRKRRAMTQLILAETVGVDAKYISRIESGISSPSFDMITKLADGLKVSPDALFCFSENETKEELQLKIDRKLELGNIEQIQLIAKITDDIITG